MEICESGKEKNYKDSVSLYLSRSEDRPVILAYGRKGSEETKSSVFLIGKYRNTCCILLAEFCGSLPSDVFCIQKKKSYHYWLIELQSKSH